MYKIKNNEASYNNIDYKKYQLLELKIRKMEKNFEVFRTGYRRNLK